MSTEFSGAERARRSVGRLVRRAPVTPRVGVAALAATQAADVLTTLFALRYVPGLEEANVVAAAAIGAFGPLLGLTLAALLAVGGVALVTELGVTIVREHAEGPREEVRTVAAVRLVGYGPLTALNVLVALHNASLVASVCCPTVPAL